MKKRLLISGIVIVLLLSLISAEETVHDVNTVPEGKSVTINGIISSFECTDADRAFIELKSNDNTIKRAQRYYKYNDQTLYFALVVDGKSEEVFLWLGDDEEQAFQKGTDIKRFFPDEYTCQDVPLALNEDFVEAWAEKGYSLIQLGEYEKALECVEKALELDPENQQALQYKKELENKIPVPPESEVPEEGEPEAGILLSGILVVIGFVIALLRH
jgi:tetratricopeptide (TPR) repeat protein